MNIENAVVPAWGAAKADAAAKVQAAQNEALRVEQKLAMASHRDSLCRGVKTAERNHGQFIKGQRDYANVTPEDFARTIFQTGLNAMPRLTSDMAGRLWLRENIELVSAELWRLIVTPCEEAYEKFLKEHPEVKDLPKVNPETDIAPSQRWIVKPHVEETTDPLVLAATGRFSEMVKA